MNSKESQKPLRKSPEVPIVPSGVNRLKKTQLTADQIAAPTYREFLNHLENAVKKEQAGENKTDTSGNPKP